MLLTCPILELVRELLHSVIVLGDDQHRHTVSRMERKLEDLFNLLLRARGDHGRALHSWRKALLLGPFCDEVQLFLLMCLFVHRLARLEEGWNDEEVRAVGLRQELLLHPVANGARETDDSVVELEHTWLRHHKETLIPRQFVSLPVHKPHDLEEVGLVVLVDHAELIRSVPHATLVLVLVVGMVFPFLDLLHKLDHLSVDCGGLSILRHQPVQWRDRLRLHAILTSSGQSHLFRVFPHGHSTILNLQLPLANVVHKLVSWILVDDKRIHLVDDEHDITIQLWVQVASPGLLSVVARDVLGFAIHNPGLVGNRSVMGTTFRCADREVLLGNVLKSLLAPPIENALETVEVALDQLLIAPYHVHLLSLRLVLLTHHEHCESGDEHGLPLTCAHLPDECLAQLVISVEEGLEHQK
mmetsp:Transcript_51972/g.138554  ORF Transcript_51972/g.138554 Transcript_51972/m.138554 type:complete len:413 (-) Transcript_51972:1344-2582(-)